MTTSQTTKTLERELATRATVSRKEWDFAREWAAELTTSQLRQVRKLQVPGDAGLAAGQELQRREAV